MIELRQIAKLFLRLAVATSMLSAVADRLGLWTKELSISGNMDKFIAHTQTLIPYAPTEFAPFLGWSATIIEVLLAVCVLIGLKLRWTASLSGSLMFVFAVLTVISSGIQTALNADVFTASAATFSILACGKGIWEVDNLLGNKRKNSRRIQMIG